jgi:inosine-uridine nucleoside N-ribohydrolase
MQKIIFETDFNYDFDDVGALAMLLTMSLQKEIELLAVMANAPEEHVAPSIQAMNNYYGFPNIPVGESKVEYPIDLWDNYNKHILKEYPASLKPGQAPDAVELYLKILAQQPDQSVKIVSVGFMNNLARLLKRPEGMDLIKRKISQCVVMVGGFEVRKGAKTGNIDTFNFARDLDAAKYFVEHWPTPIVCTNIGPQIATGNRLFTECDEKFITRRLFQLWKENTDKGEYNKPDYNRSSWDQAAVLYAVRGLGQNFEFAGENGSLEVSFKEKNRAIVKWVPEPKRGISYIVAKGEDSAIAKEIEDLMVFDPKRAAVRAGSS